MWWKSFNVAENYFEEFSKITSNAKLSPNATDTQGEAGRYRKKPMSKMSQRCAQLMPKWKHGQLKKYFLNGSITTLYWQHELIAEKLVWMKSQRSYFSWITALYIHLLNCLWKIMFSSLTFLPMWHSYYGLVTKEFYIPWRQVQKPFHELYDCCNQQKRKDWMLKMPFMWLEVLAKMLKSQQWQMHDEYFEGFCITNEQGISRLIIYAKSVSNKNIKNLEEADCFMIHFCH